MPKDSVVSLGPPSPAPLLSLPISVAGSGDISTCGIPEEGVFQVFPRGFFAALCCFVGLWEDAGELLKGILRILPEDLELLLLSSHSPDKFGHEGYVMEDGNVFPRD